MKDKDIKYRYIINAHPESAGIQNVCERYRVHDQTDYNSLNFNPVFMKIVLLEMNKTDRVTGFCVLCSVVFKCLST